MEFDNPLGFMRARACWTYGQFAAIPYSDEANLLAALEKIMGCLADPEMPVRVEAALALRMFLKGEQCMEQVATVVPQLLEALFALMDDVENEELVDTLSVVVEQFPEQIVPYAVQLATKLSESFSAYTEDDGGEEDENCSGEFAAAYCLGTIGTLLESLRSVPELFPMLEAALLPMLAYNLATPEMISFLEETLEVVLVFTQLSKTVTADFWQLLPVMVTSFHDEGYDYLCNFMPPFLNFVQRGTAYLLDPAVSAELLPQFLSIFDKIMKHSDASQREMGHACQLGDALLLCCPHVLLILCCTVCLD